MSVLKAVLVLLAIRKPRPKPLTTAEILATWSKGRKVERR